MLWDLRSGGTFLQLQLDVLLCLDVPGVHRVLSIGGGQVILERELTEWQTPWMFPLTCLRGCTGSASSSLSGGGGRGR